MSRPGAARRLPWSYLLLEGSLIVLSVLLGFAISEWRESRADEALAERVLETLRREVVANREELHTALANHEEVVALVAEGAETVGIRPAILRNSAWSTAQATGATVQLDYEVTELAAGLAELQSLHRDAQMMALDQLAAIRLREDDLPASRVQRIRMDTWGALIGLERKLMEEYGRALDVLGGGRPSDVPTSERTP